jgi:hypothetical protein
MKWKLYPKTESKIGDVRDVKKFAWFPVIAWSVFEECECRVWLQTYVQEQMYIRRYTALPHIGVVKENNWVKVKNYVKDYV